MKTEQKPDNQNAIEFLKFLLFILFPAFVFVDQTIEKRALKAKNITGIRVAKYSSKAGLIISSVLMFLSFLVSLKMLQLHHQKLALLAYAIWVLSQVPLSGMYFLYKFDELLMKSNEGRINPFIAGKLRRAKIQHGSQYAIATYPKIASRLDLPSNFIGKRIEPINSPTPLLRDSEIQESEFLEVIDGAYGIFPLDPKSPKHHLVVGQTGSGKTVLLKRMIKAGLLNGWKVVLLDLKGDPYDAPSFLNLEPDQSKVREYPSTCFYFWSGTPIEIAERLISFIPLNSNPFYLSRNIFAINSVIIRSETDTPKSVEEFLERLRNGFNIARNEADRKFFGVKDKGTPVGDLISNDMASYLESIRNAEARTPMRFHWGENWNYALFRLDGFKPTSLTIANVILNDFSSWLFSDARAMSKKPILFIIDEASAFSALPQVPILASLMDRARSAKVSLVYASQNLSAFGIEKENILHAGSIRWIGLSTDVEDMVSATGTENVLESGHQYDGDEYTGTVTHRMQKAFKIDPDLVKESPVFHWFVSWGGRFSQLYVPPERFH